MLNKNTINLDLIPVGKVDNQISCAKCPSACCRQGMILPLSQDEATSLEHAGTQMHQLNKRDAQGNNPGRGRKFYQLDSDCGNLSIDSETGQTSCDIYGEDSYPRACAEFKMGGYACALTQLTRIQSGEDTIQESAKTPEP